MADKSSMSQFGEELSGLFKFDATTFLVEFDRVAKAANEITGVFTQGRQRIGELMTSLTDATPGVLRLGGELTNVTSIISDVAEASRRNVIASTEEISKLYAAEKILGTESVTLANAFLDIGTGIEKISDTLEESINYIQSIGGNAKSVMKDVTTNMAQMNRFQFEGGVLGLTKMAAQASMLRFNMNETFQLADRVLSPEGAIETASAFQRLGVASGALGDPFALMTASINDPGALQDSLVDVAKQFTYFDEKTKTFKINPQGVLTLKELQQQTGVSASEMSKLGLAAAEADMRLSAIGAAGLNIEEDDKQYIANIAKMGKTGKYEVELKDHTKKELAELSQPEFDKLIKEQKEGPKTLEEIAKSQMTTTELLYGDVRAIRSKIVGGVISADPILEVSKGIREGFTTVTDGINKKLDTKDVRKQTEGALNDLSTLFTDLMGKNKSKTDSLADYLEKADKQLGGIGEGFEKNLKELSEEFGKKTMDNKKIQSLLEESKTYLKDKIDENAQKKITPQSITSFVEGRESRIKEVSTNGATTQVSNQKSQVEFIGGIKIEVISPPGFDNEKISKIMNDKLSSIGAQQYMINVNGKPNPLKNQNPLVFPISNA